MQRRAAAVYVAVFLLVGTASYALIATAERPAVRFDDPEFELERGDEFAVDGRTYTVTEITAEVEGGDGHGGGGDLVRSGALAWINESARHTETWETGSTVTVDGTEFEVQTDATDGETGRVRLVETQNRSAILAADPAADDETVSRDGEAFVVVTENGSARLVATDEYFPARPTVAYAEGETFALRGNRTTVAAVTNESATVAWTAPRTNTVELTDETNATLAGQRYFVYFPDNSTVQLESDPGVYADQTAEIDEFVRHRNGLWGVTILSGVASVLLVGMAFLPSRY